jgi:hypothetical protein
VSVEQLSPVEWLSGADFDPEHAYNWWLGHPGEVAMLPMGVLFDAVKTGQAHGQRVLSALDDTQRRCPSFVNAELGTHYFLVAPGTAAAWPSEAPAECLGDKTWLWVPAPTRIRRDGSYWACPPDGTGLLHDPQALLDALAAIRGAA